MGEHPEAHSSGCCRDQRLAAEASHKKWRTLCSHRYFGGQCVCRSITQGLEISKPASRGVSQRAAPRGMLHLGILVIPSPPGRSPTQKVGRDSKLYGIRVPDIAFPEFGPVCVSESPSLLLCGISSSRYTSYPLGFSLSLQRHFPISEARSSPSCLRFHLCPRHRNLSSLGRSRCADIWQQVSPPSRCVAPSVFLWDPAGCGDRLDEMTPNPSASHTSVIVLVTDCSSPVIYRRL